MNLVFKKTASTDKNQYTEIRKKVTEGLNAFHSDDLTTYVFTATRRDTFTQNVKAINLIMELDYLYNPKLILDHPDRIEEYVEISKAIKTINKIAGKRSYLKRKQRREQNNKQKGDTENKKMPKVESIKTEETPDKESN